MTSDVRIRGATAPGTPLTHLVLELFTEGARTRFESGSLRQRCPKTRRAGLPTTQLMPLLQDAFLGSRLFMSSLFLNLLLFRLPHYYHLTTITLDALHGFHGGHVFAQRRCLSCCFPFRRYPSLVCSSVALRSRPLLLFSLTALYIRGHTLTLSSETVKCGMVLISISILATRNSVRKQDANERCNLFVQRNISQERGCCGRTKIQCTKVREPRREE